MSIIKLKDQVEYILSHIRVTRDSDKLLVLEVYKKYYDEFVDRDGLPMSIKAYMSLPSESNIKRYRAQFNRKAMYLPTIEAIAVQRRLNIDTWLESLGYKVTPEDGQINFL